MEELKARALFDRQTNIADLNNASSEKRVQMQIEAQKDAVTAAGLAEESRFQRGLTAAETVLGEERAYAADAPTKELAAAVNQELSAFAVRYPHATGAQLAEKTIEAKLGYYNAKGAGESAMGKITAEELKGLMDNISANEDVKDNAEKVGMNVSDYIQQKALQQAVTARGMRVGGKTIGTGTASMVEEEGEARYQGYATDIKALPPKEQKVEIAKMRKVNPVYADRLEAEIASMKPASTPSGRQPSVLGKAVTGAGSMARKLNEGTIKAGKGLLDINRDIGLQITGQQKPTTIWDRLK